MQAEKVSISEIKINPNNPRIIKDYKFSKLVKSIRAFPQMLELRPIVVNEHNVILGGNMRYKASVEAGLQEVSIIRANDLTPDQQREFVIKDNVGFGEWDWDLLANDWDSTQLGDWGLDAWQNMDDIETSDEFSLPDQDKPKFQQITWTVADEQAEVIKAAINDIKKTDEFKYVETFGNENSNGNALYLIIQKLNEQQG